MLKEGLLQILEKVYDQKDFDFRQYKESSLTRRIERRLRATKTESYNQYIDLLDDNPAEYTSLIDVLTIQVTEFFRNPEAWTVLRQEVLPEIIKAKTGIQIWSAGCASGEETYSAAILADDLLETSGYDFGLTVIGTDIDQKSLADARRAEYQPDAVKTIPQDAVNKYFDYDGNFKVRPYIRNKVCFKTRNLAQDSPPQQMDLIICRNVAIYFQRSLQMKIFEDFYNALNKGGYLFLGKAETLVGPMREKFVCVNKRWRIYQKL